MCAQRGVRDGHRELLDSTHPLLDAVLYLDDELLDTLREHAGIVPYVILQRLGDAVLVPAGCAHQVHNLRCCVKVAADFVAPEHVDHCVRLTEELRQLPARHHRRADVLSVRSILFYAACACIATLEESKRREEQRRRAAARHTVAPPPPEANPPAAAAAGFAAALGEGMANALSL